MINTSPISCNFVSVERLHVVPAAMDRDMAPIGMPIGARDPGCGQGMWGKFIPTSKSHRPPQVKLKPWQQSSPRKGI
ncbi:MAG TPA: hypothetical protein VK553_04555 [Candidatus Nitrosopolaris rasttigaisensis]|nr:hypothetical protein [Candidatus Nitrosopolaris rasttigaisensis]